uniref:Rx N-terminal domain-containing protein n=1 Tax=Fagus sylvatica TaxID=28930 RepID=A0A2N9GJD8_FAGSY
MAELVLSVVAEGIMAKVMSLTSEHISSAWGFKEELRKLRESLTKIQAVLNDAEKRQVSDESVRIWLLELKDVAYRADNVLDVFGYEILRQKVETQNKKKVRSFFSLSNPIVFSFKMVNKIKNINQSLDRIKTDIAVIGLRMESVNSIPKFSLDRETDSFIDDSEVIGRGDDVLEIVNLLIGAGNQQAISVIPIVGMAGLGKTTIAKLVYKHELVKKHFDVMIWVCVSEDFDVKKILREILEFLDKLPKDLRNLINLRHINISHRYIKQLPIDMGRLTCLQTLPFFVIGQDAGRGIEELGCLSQLRGELDIYNLEYVRDKEEAKTANLASRKAGLHKLGFHWSSEREGNNNDVDVLEGLQPNPHLKSLEIQNFMGERFPSWILASDNSMGDLLIFNHLLEIRLSYCKKCEEIPTLGHLPCLKVIEIKGMDNVKCIGTEFYSNYSAEGSSNIRGDSDRIMLFPALKRLVLMNMPNLMEWKDTTEPTTRVVVFPCLEELTIQECGQMKSAPCHFPFLKKLKIRKICSTAFENISSKLTTLTSLDIGYISGLAYLPEQVLKNNTSLMSLEIWYCDDMVSISISPHEDVWAFCTSLRSFFISSCKKLSYLPDALHNLRSIEKFVVANCPNLRSFPSIQGVASLLRSLVMSCGDEVLPIGLQSCTSLSELSITTCPNLISIPDLREFHSLTQLGIWNCPNLKSIPDLQELHSLTEVGISKCRKLPRLPECLKSLTIGGFHEELDAFPSLSSIQHLHASLQTLRLDGWANLNSLPDEIQRFTALKRLRIWRFHVMEALPEWLGNLSSLQSLSLFRCKNLTYLPTAQAMRRLIKLEELRIHDCPKLKERCGKGSDTEWSKIAHIPEIIIDREYI